MDAAAVIINVLAGIRNSGDDEKINAPEIINADTMKPLSEIIILALVAANASSSISERTALRNMVSTPLAVPISLMRRLVLRFLRLLFLEGCVLGGYAASDVLDNSSVCLAKRACGVF